MGTLDEYFDVESRSEAKHEFSDGVIRERPGGSPRHNAVATNVFRIVSNALRGGPYQEFGCDQRIATPGGLYTYPDLSVFCAPMVLIGGRPSTAANPSVLIEILSDSSRDYDRGEKLDRYRRMPSVVDIVLIEPGFPRVEHWTRAGDDWVRTVHEDGSVRLAGCGVDLPLVEVYEHLDGLAD